MTQTELGLAGIHVLDLSRVLAAPYATMALGDLGAEIIKIERPGSGDETREWGPPFWGDQSAYFLSANRNKKSCVVDLTTDEGRDLIRTLALQWADVVVENFKPGALLRYQIDLAGMRKVNPRLITASLRGYPAGDDRPGYDFVMQAGAGLMSLTGPEEGPPYKVGIAAADITAGLFLLSGILSALLVRERSGIGQHLDVSLFDSQVAWWANVGMAHLVTGQTPRRWGNAHPQLSPYELFEASDGYLALAVGNDQQFRSLCQLLGHPEWGTDARYHSNPQRVQHRDSLHELLQNVFALRDVGYWTATLDAHNVPAGPVRNIPQALAWRNTLPSPVVSWLDETPQINLPWHFSSLDSQPRQAPPRLGQHTEEVWSLYRTLRKDL
ncbi:MAG: CaiB/BaiF CoA transferase family protein [Sulfobacillus sp.]